MSSAGTELRLLDTRKASLDTEAGFLLGSEPTVDNEGTDTSKVAKIDIATRDDTLDPNSAVCVVEVKVIPVWVADVVDKTASTVAVATITDSVEIKAAVVFDEGIRMLTVSVVTVASSDVCDRVSSEERLLADMVCASGAVVGVSTFGTLEGRSPETSALALGSFKKFGPSDTSTEISAALEEIVVIVLEPEN